MEDRSCFKPYCNSIKTSWKNWSILDDRWSILLKLYPHKILTCLHRVSFGQAKTTLKPVLSQSLFHSSPPANFEEICRQRSVGDVEVWRCDAIKMSDISTIVGITFMVIGGLLVALGILLCYVTKVSTLTWLFRGRSLMTSCKIRLQMSLRNPTPSHFNVRRH